MCRGRESEKSVRAIILGSGIAVCTATILLFGTGCVLLDSDWPDYHDSKFQMTFGHLYPGLKTWPCAGGILLGIGIAIVGGIRPYLHRKKPRK